MDEAAQNYLKEKEKEERSSNFWSNFQGGYIILIIIVIFAIISMSNTEKIDSRYYLVIIIGLGIFIAYLIFKPNKEKHLIPEPVIKDMAQAALNKKVREGKEFPFDSKVEVTAVCHLNHEIDLGDGSQGYTAWEIGWVERVHGSNYKKDGVAIFHPYEGLLTGLEYRPLGYSGRESRDVLKINLGIIQGLNNIKASDINSGK